MDLKYIKINSFNDIIKIKPSKIFTDLFSKNISEIYYIINTNNDYNIEMKVNFGEDTSNYLNIVHGGSMGILAENLSNIFLYYFTKNKYNTKDINIIYKRQVYLEREYTLKIKIEKIKFKTVFLQFDLYNKNNECATTITVIKEKIPLTKI